MKKSEGPSPAALLMPWLADNEAFQRELLVRNDLVSNNLAPIRERIENLIRKAESVEPCTLGAVDAASRLSGYGDLLSILVQVIHVADDGTPTIGPPQRISGVDGHDLRLVVTPMRVAGECEELAKARTPTIADTSYWSFLYKRPLVRVSRGAILESRKRPARGRGTGGSMSAEPVLCSQLACAGRHGVS
jgi:hypothetical protein